jgi:CDGSH-type Zn-finger protein
MNRSRDPHIVVSKDGPYRVRGSVPVLPGRILEDEDGQSADWEIGEPLTSGKRAVLCRCGNSSTKPFCDDTHLRGFDGTETADRGPTDDRRDEYPGAGVTLTDDMSLCTTAAFCHDRVTSVWQLMAETGDLEVRARVEGIVARCPSGRLVLETDGGEQVEPEYEPSIVVEEGGPYWVRGRIPIESEDGTPWEVRNRVALCRCGRSENKPFCDATHRAVGFRG